MSSLPRCDVVIVGAGITGLVAAEALTRDEATVMVFEARDRVGGRVYSIFAGTGTVDLGATWSWPDEELTRSLTERLGVPTFSQRLLGDALFEADHLGPRRLDGNPIDVPSFRFAGGTHSLAARLAHRLPRGTIRLHDPVSAISVEPDGAHVDARTSSTRADQVIVAVPPALALEQITFTPELPLHRDGLDGRAHPHRGRLGGRTYPDPCDHYSRPDAFDVSVDRRRRQASRFTD